MSLPIEILEAEVLKLTTVDRSRLLDRLLASLESDSEWEEAWAQEATRREADIAAGKSEWVPGEDSVARLNATY